ncbi:hypothetical protein SLA2020_388440 [Shorea laevis]
MAFEKGASSLKSVKINETGKVDGTNNLATERKFSVLVVDDDILIRKIHSMILSKFPMEIQVAENGKEAVDLYRSGAFFDLVLMDMEMPVMNGLEATKELRAMGVNSMIVGVTSNSERKDFMEAGLTHCYAKPLTVEMIKPLLQELNKNN